METIIAASQNRHKIAEIEAITGALGYRVISRAEAGLPDDEIEEDGNTFEENSYKKASVIMEMCGKPTIADDSGLMVDCLDGAPGVWSARFAGEGCTYADNNEKLLRLMKDVPEEKRTAKFVTVITMLFPDGRKIVARGECPGRIIGEERGEGGFGYDPLFIPDGRDLTFAEMAQEEKNLISHRARALAELKRQLEAE